MIAHAIVGRVERERTSSSRESVTFRVRYRAPHVWNSENKAPPPQGTNHPYKAPATPKRRHPTGSTIEVAHFRYFVSERRGFFDPKSPGCPNLDFEKKKKVRSLGPWHYSPRFISKFARVSFRASYGALLK